MKKFVWFVVLLAAVICCVSCAPKDEPDVDYKLIHAALLPEHLYFMEYRKKNED